MQLSAIQVTNIALTGAAALTAAIIGSHLAAQTPASPPPSHSHATSQTQFMQTLPMDPEGPWPLMMANH